MENKAFEVVITVNEREGLKLSTSDAISALELIGIFEVAKNSVLNRDMGAVAKEFESDTEIETEK